jgi:hypothetical protein
MKKLFKKIAKFWNKITGKAKKIIQDHIEPAITVVQLLKDAVENPAMNLLTAITPFNWDDIAVKAAKNLLPVALLELKILKDASGKSTSEMVRQIIEEIRKYTKSDRAKFYEDIAAKLAVMLADGKLSIDEAAELVKFVYEEKFKNHE